MSSFHEPFGISADLGGGSMELAMVERTRVGDRASCHLGSLRIIDSTDITANLLDLGFGIEVSADSYVQTTGVATWC